MGVGLIFDSDVLIWFFRGNENAKKIVRVNIPFSISAVSYMELIQGALNKQELLGIKKFLEKSETKIIPMKKRSESNISSIKRDSKIKKVNNPINNNPILAVILRSIRIREIIGAHINPNIP